MGFQNIKKIAAAIAMFSGLVQGQLPPKPEGVTVLESKLVKGVKISYKENDLCETTPGVKSFSGYVHLPPGALKDIGIPDQNYNINTFFWFFESRKDPMNAPLSIWLNGGPGSSSMIGLLEEHGSCFVNDDSNSTRLNPWSWNNEVNMLFLDQPVQVGLSYDSLQNVTVNMKTGQEGVRPADFSNGIPKQNNTFLVGTQPSNNPNATTMGTEKSARALWHFAQTWFQEFPGYKPNDDRISLATESYGGRYGPAFAAYFQKQNEKIRNGTFPNPGLMHILHLDTLLLINACIDRVIQYPTYPRMAFNNSYGIQVVSQATYNEMEKSLPPCMQKIRACQDAAAKSDPMGLGMDPQVNRICMDAENFCSAKFINAYFEGGKSFYDISSDQRASFPPPWKKGWLNQQHVQRELGVPLNWTVNNPAVNRAFRAIGDIPRAGRKEDLAYLLDSGVKVHMLFGDRDYACNWYGGEALSLAIPWSHQKVFAAAGYTPFMINNTHVGGQTRQYGNLSYTRIFDAGHEVPAYQPEGAFNHFMRSLFNKDIATGKIVTGAANPGYSTNGTRSIDHIRNKPVHYPPAKCYILDKSSCTDKQWRAVEDGTAIIKNWVVQNVDP